MAVLAYALSAILAMLLPVQAAQNSTVTSTDDCLPGSAVHCIGSQPTSASGMALSGTISSLLMPVTGDMMDNSTMMADETRQQAMRFSMAQNVTWILGGNWSLSRTGNATDFNATFTKVTTGGEMRHTHRISNFTVSPGANATDALRGTADLYFNGELAWKQAGITLTFVKEKVLVMEFDSGDIDSHFHDMPVYGVVMTRQ